MKWRISFTWFDAMVKVTASSSFDGSETLKLR